MLVLILKVLAIILIVFIAFIIIVLLLNREDYSYYLKGSHIYYNLDNLYDSNPRLIMWLPNLFFVKENRENSLIFYIGLNWIVFTTGVGISIKTKSRYIKV